MSYSIGQGIANRLESKRLKEEAFGCRRERIAGPSTTAASSLRWNAGYWKRCRAPPLETTEQTVLPENILAVTVIDIPANVRNSLIDLVVMRRTIGALRVRRPAI